MNMNKKLIALIAGLAGVVLCVALMLFSCNGGQQSPATEPSLPDNTVESQVTDAVTEETAEETTEEPTEETTEETTEPEETTAPTQPSGSNRPGGTGGFEGGSTPTVPTEPTEPKELITAESGSKTLPYAESLAKLPDSLETVEIPAGKTVSYQLFGVQGSVLTIQDSEAYVVCGEKTYGSEAGVVTVAIPAAKTIAGPVSMEIGNKATNNKVFQLSFDYALGSQQKPEAITSIDQIQLELAGTYYYVWTAAESGTLTMKAEAAENTAVSCKVELTITSTDANGVTTVLNGTAGEDGTSIPVDVNDEVIICVTTEGAEKAVKVNVSGTFLPTLGSISNPISLGDLLSLEPIQVEPGTTYYSCRASEMTLTIFDAQDLALICGDQTILPDEFGILTFTFPKSQGMGPAAPDVFGLTNGTEEAKTYSLIFTYPEGHPEQPAYLMEGENTATIAADNGDGYNFVWDAPYDGKLTITMTSENWQYMLTNETAGEYGDLCDSAQDPSTATTVLAVSAGDHITLMVNGFDPADSWALPGGTVTFNMMYEDIKGTEENPYMIEEPAEPYEISVPAKTTYYISGLISGVPMTIENAAGASVTLNSVTTAADINGLLKVEFPEIDTMGRPQPVVFMLTNGTDTDAFYTLNFHYPLGSQQNPDKIQEGANEALVEAENELGYAYGWTAPDSGKLTITMTGAAWQYIWVNKTSGIGGELFDSSLEPSAAVAEIEVAAGDEIELTVNGFDPEDPWAYPGGTVTFTAAFESDRGAEHNPFPIMDDNDGDVGIITYTTPSQAAGEPVYYAAHASGYKLVITGQGDFTAIYNGVEYLAVEGMITIPKFIKTGSNALVAINGQGTFRITLEAPLGALENPDTLSLEEAGNAAVVETGTDGYYYTYTATEDGILVLNAYESQNPDGYQVSAINLDTYAMSDMLDQTSGFYEVTVDMKAGETIQVVANTFDPANWSTPPAGQVLFYATCRKPLGHEENPITIMDNDGTDGDVITFTTGVQEAGKPLYYEMRRAPGYDLVITGEGVFTAAYNGNTYTAEGGKVTVPAFQSQNMYTAAQVILDGAGVFRFRMEPPKGSLGNPIELNVSTAKGNVAPVAAGSIEGYYFLFTSDVAGTLTLTADPADNAAGFDIRAESLISSVTREGLTQEAESFVLEMDVIAADQIRVSAITFDPANEFETPAGTVTFTAVFTPAPAPAVASVLEYEGVATPTAPIDIALDEGRMLNYLDVTRAEGYALVLDETTGFYHLDDLTGPVVYVNLGGCLDNLPPYLSLKETIETPFGAAGESFVACMEQYIACADADTGLYPLTADLAYMIYAGGAERGWWDSANSAYLFPGLGELGLTLNPNSGWLFACCTIG